ncbi:MAG: peptidoglycan DD-metalloendopeptidase family protein [Anaerolineaceae bacterium]
MTESKNAKQPEAGPESDDLTPKDQEIPAFEPNEKVQKPLYKQPGMQIAILLVLIALILLVVWITKRASDNPSGSIGTATLTSSLNQPQVTHDQGALEPNPSSTLFSPSTITPQPTVAPRTEVITYVIEEGDSIFSIAEKFNLSPETLLWSNRYELGDDPKMFTAGTQIYILPVDGVYHMWQSGEGLNGVSEFYGVTPDTIIDYPPNHLDRATLGDLSLPNIAAGTRLVVPGGTRPETVSADSLLTYAAKQEVESLPVATPETYPAPREELVAYLVGEGETIFIIADKFGLKPETVLWANRYLIGDTPDGIYPGQKLFILPSDGVYHGWSHGEGLNGVSEFYGVSPDVIIDEPLNNLDRASLGDLSLPNIRAGTLLYVPGGTRPAATWVTTVSPTDDGTGTHPNVSYLGAYACNSTANAVGTGNWQFPTSEHWISGYEYNPPTHNGLDYAGRLGFDIYAADSGVIIYSGWSTRGYGNTIVIDHGNGYLSLYAHIMDGGFIQGCGTIVTAGQLIAYMGSTGQSTGPHLHFEIRYNGSSINPHDLGL